MQEFIEVKPKSESGSKKQQMWRPDIVSHIVAYKDFQAKYLSVMITKI